MELGLDEELAFLLGLTHDIHQKLVEDRMTTLKIAKKYIREKLDELGYVEYFRYIDDALEVDACGKERPVRGQPKEMATVCHIGDMLQGRLESLALLEWLRRKVESLDNSLTVRFYGVMTPQPFTRTYIMQKVYENHIKDSEILTLTSPWGLYVVAHKDDLPEVLKISWDELRIDPIMDYEMIKDVEKRKKSATINRINISKDEARNKMWSAFARMFYKVEELDGSTSLYPVLPEGVAGLFINVEFTDIKFLNLNKTGKQLHKCSLCGLPHLKEQSIVTNMYGKIAGIGKRFFTSEKWNRFLPAHTVVRGWGGQWKSGLGLCPLCTLDAVAVRELKFSDHYRGWFLVAGISKPVPLSLLRKIGVMLRYAKERDLSLERLPGGVPDGLLTDYNTASIVTTIGGTLREPKTENMFAKNGAGELYYLGRLIEHGIYPLKYMYSIDTVVSDRLLVTTHTFKVLDFPVTSKQYGNLIPWIAVLLRVAGSSGRREGMDALSVMPVQAPLLLLSLNKFEYDRVSSLLHMVGVKA